MIGLGTVNGYSVQRATFGKKNFTYDGTTRGLERAALAVGAVAGDRVTTHVLGARTYVLEFNPHIEHNSARVQAVRVRL